MYLINNSQDLMLQAFEKEIARKYQIYNGLFLDLPFEKLEEAGSHLPLFFNHCKKGLSNKLSPVQIVEDFLKEINLAKAEDNLDLLFLFLQFIERQVVLFDALEEAGFEKVNDLQGSGTLNYLINSLIQSKPEKQILLKEILEEYKIRITLTAHPTQFYPNSILGIISDLTVAIKQNNLEEISNLLLQMARTSFRNNSKPSPLDEAKSLIWYLENIFYEALPSIQKQLNSEKTCLELGFWPGGDRDGNPFVTADITLKVAQTLKNSLIELYLKDIQKLKRRLTFNGILESLIEVENKLQACIITDCEVELGLAYLTANDLISDLKSIESNLQRKYKNLFLADLQDFIRKVEVFGFHFASLDLRQDSRIHGQVIAEILGIDYLALSISEKVKLLKDYTESQEVINYDFNGLTDLAKETINSFKVAKKIQVQNGLKALRRYVISNTQNIANIFEVFFLACCSGWELKDLDLEIIPLFETIEDLKNAEDIMNGLYKDQVYFNYLKKYNHKQIVMLGFSDGTKDGGYFMANWSIFKAKQNLTKISRKADIKIIFFDGRGGPPSRGGGNTHKFYRSLGSSIESEQIQLTIQGQTISSKFGTKESAQFNLEQLLTAGLEPKLFTAQNFNLSPDQKDNWELIESLADLSYKAYLELRNDKLFIPYLEEITPLKYYSSLKIGSRPVKRGSSDKLKFEDLRAIPFVGAWTQMKQNILGFYGLGSALKSLISRDSKTKENLQKLYQECLFFRALLENSMQSLAKSNFALTEYLREDKKFANFWLLLKNEAELTSEMLKEISQEPTLMENSLVSKASIQLREKIVLPLLVIQHYAMCKAREPEINASKKEIFEKIIIKSLAANVNASRNSV
jgi:phosphoenolpyruvate carboxylase